MPTTDWLEAQDRIPSSSEFFEVRDITQSAPPDGALVQELATAVVTAKTSLDFLRAVEPLLGWSVVSARVAESKQVSVNRGDFGEVLGVRWLAEHDELTIPVEKLKSKITPGQTQPGCDIVAFELEGGLALTRLHLVEVKLRTSSNTGAGVDAYRQHERRHAGDLDALLMFILEELWNSDPVLFAAMAEHLQQRLDAPDDAYDIVLIYAEDRWSEKCLSNVDDVAGGDIEPLQMHVMKIPDLRNLIDSVFGAIGVSILDDPDDVDD